MLVFIDSTHFGLKLRTCSCKLTDSLMGEMVRDWVDRSFNNADRVQYHCIYIRQGAALLSVTFFSDFVWKSVRLKRCDVWSHCFRPTFRGPQLRRGRENRFAPYTGL